MAKASNTNTRYGAPAKGREASARATGDRACDRPGCATVLSTYNASPTCWLHTGPELKHPLARS